MRTTLRGKWGALGVALILAMVRPGWAESDADTGAEARVCIEQAARFEKQQGLPRRLLAAISLAESGRWNAEERVTFAWPWTVYAQGRGRYFPSKAAALEEVRRLIRGGVRNIDVGCMQINLLYHGDAFASLEEALEPEPNVAYAARFIKRLHQDTRSWTQAIAFYHSRTQARNLPYRRKVYQLWGELHRRAAEERRLRGLAEHRKRREQRLAAAARAAD
jgi:hypothetical protein